MSYTRLNTAAYTFAKKRLKNPNYRTQTNTIRISVKSQDPPPPPFHVDIHLGLKFFSYFFMIYIHNLFRANCDLISVVYTNLCFKRSIMKNYSRIRSGHVASGLEGVVPGWGGGGHADIFLNWHVKTEISLSPPPPCFGVSCNKCKWKWGYNSLPPGLEWDFHNFENFPLVCVWFIF